MNQYLIRMTIDNKEIETRTNGDSITYHVNVSLDLSFVCVNTKEGRVIAIVPAKNLISIVKVDSD